MLLSVEHVIRLCYSSKKLNAYVINIQKFYYLLIKFNKYLNVTQQMLNIITNKFWS